MGYGMSFPKYARLDKKAQAAAYDRHIYPLSGFTKGDEAKVTIIGKLRGYDPDFTSEQLSDLKNFINESKGLFVEYIQAIVVFQRNVVFIFNQIFYREA